MLIFIYIHLIKFRVVWFFGRGDFHLFIFLNLMGGWSKSQRKTSGAHQKSAFGSHASAHHAKRENGTRCRGEVGQGQLCLSISKCCSILHTEYYKNSTERDASNSHSNSNTSSIKKITWNRCILFMWRRDLHSGGRPRCPLMLHLAPENRTWKQEPHTWYLRTPVHRGRDNM